MKLFLTLWYLLISLGKKAQLRGKWIAPGVLAVVLIGGSVAIFTEPLTSKDLCGNAANPGTWESTGLYVDIAPSEFSDIRRIDQYRCEVEKKNALCTSLSGTKRTCYPALSLTSVQNILLVDFNKDVTTYRYEDVNIVNNTCQRFPAVPENGTAAYWLPCEQYNHTISHPIVTTVYSHQELFFKGKIIRPENHNYWCFDNTSNVCCKSVYDGDGEKRVPGIKEGMEYFCMNKISKEFETSSTLRRTDSLNLKGDLQ